MNKTEEITKIVNFLKKYKIENATINKVNDDFIVDVDDTVFLWRKGLTEIPIQFGKVNGNFDCSDNYISHLKGCPKYVRGDFNCCYNQLTSLKGCPRWVGGNFYCEGNSQITPESLKEIEGVDGFIYSDFFVGKLEDYKGEL